MSTIHVTKTLFRKRKNINYQISSSPVVTSSYHYHQQHDRNQMIPSSLPLSTSFDNNNKQIIYNGVCKQNACGKEAGCHTHSSDTYTCICPHDGSPPTTDFKCPNRITVPITPQPIHNIIPPRSVNITTILINNNIHSNIEQNNKTTLKINNNNNNNNNNNLLLSTINNTAIISSSILIILILITLICWWKRKYLCKCFGLNRNPRRTRKSSCTTATSPMNLKKSLLVAERYTPNPQYSACTTSPNVPLLTRDSLKFTQEIGEGCFGKVFKGELYKNIKNKNNIEIVAIKVLKESASLEAEEDFMREVDIMSAFRHKNILTLIGVVLRELNTNNNSNILSINNNSPWMIFEYMPYGDLAEVLRTNCKSSILYNNKETNKSNNSFNKYYDDQDNNGLEVELLPNIELNDEHLLSAALQIADGMRYLAGQRFVHRDLACRNCLVGKHFTVKIADFGMSRDVYTCDYYKIGGSRLLPVRWMSPESVMYGRFTLESDVWSYGVILWEIFSYGKQPYYGHNNEEVVKLILQGIMLIPSDECPTEICNLMKYCWKTEPKDRIRFVDIYERLNQYILNRNNKSINNIETLPRPPTVIPNVNVISSNFNFDLLEDREGYLLPTQQPQLSINNNINNNTDYMQTLPD